MADYKRLGDFEEGARVRLVDEAIKEERSGTVVGLIVSEVRVRFDDGAVITFSANDDGFESLSKPENPEEE